MKRIEYSLFFFSFLFSQHFANFAHANEAQQDSKKQANHRQKDKKGHHENEKTFLKPKTDGKYFHHSIEGDTLCQGLGFYREVPEERKIDKTFFNQTMWEYDKDNRKFVASANGRRTHFAQIRCRQATPKESVNDGIQKFIQLADWKTDDHFEFRKFVPKIFDIKPMNEWGDVEFEELVPVIIKRLGTNYLLEQMRDKYPVPKAREIIYKKLFDHEMMKEELKNINYSVLKFLVDNWSPWKYTGLENRTILSVFVVSKEPDSREYVEKMLKQGADPNQRSRNNKRPLQLALKERKTPVVKNLLQYGANPLLKGLDDENSLFTMYQMAGQQKNAQDRSQYLMSLFDVLLENTPAEPAEKSIELKRALLVMDLASYYPESTKKLPIPRHETIYLVKKLSQDGFKFADLKQERTLTPLYVIAASGDVDILNMLLKSDLSPNQLSFEKYLPLHIALINNNAPVVMALLDHGADLQVKSSLWISPLEMIQQDSDDKIAEDLIRQIVSHEKVSAHCKAQLEQFLIQE